MNYATQQEELDKSLKTPQPLDHDERLLALRLAIESGTTMQRCIIALLRDGKAGSTLEYVVRQLNLNLCHARAELKKLQGINDSTAAAGS